MKNLLAYGIIAIMLAPHVGKLYVLVDFAVNRDFIAHHLCVQKNVKDNHCQGACHLKQKMTEQEKNQSRSPLQQQEEWRANWYCDARVGFDFSCPAEWPRMMVPAKTGNVVRFIPAVFHPPA